MDFSGRMGLWGNLGMKTQTQVTYADHRMIPIKRAGSSREPCEDQIDYDRCMTSNLERLMTSEANCTVPWLRSEQPVCTDPAAAKVAFGVWWRRSTNQRQDCRSPCHSLQAQMGALNTEQLDVSNSNSTYGLMFLYFPQKVRMSQEEFLYTFLTLLAEIGGYVGLFLGVSVNHFAEWFKTYMKIKIKRLEDDIEGKEKEHESNGHLLKQILHIED